MNIKASCVIAECIKSESSARYRAANARQVKLKIAVDFRRKACIDFTKRAIIAVCVERLYIGVGNGIECGCSPWSGCGR